MSHTIPASDLYGAPSASNVTAVLGPTNTGKTHLAIERMLAYDSGVIGLPLRLLAREVYDRIVAKVGAGAVALITGEEKIKPPQARYWVSTVEAMPRDLTVDFVAVDEIQLAGDPERGHVFTDRLFHARGTQETLLLGAETMRTCLTQLLPGVNFISRPRLSKLTYAGPKKISRLPRRSAIVAFSVNDVYEIAEFVRRQRGGAAVVLGALSPRTRNAQVEMYQSGDVDFLVATDAIGMGLNLDVTHVAFAGARKFDGVTSRDLYAHEIAQIAGRAGRHIKDGTFGVTGDVLPFASDLINQVEAHEFEPIKALQWRASSLDYESVPRLLASLKTAPQKPYLMMARAGDDVAALEALAETKEILDVAKGPSMVRRLWDVCQVPDYRKIGLSEHGDLIKKLLSFILRDEGHIPDEWFRAQIEQHDRVDGDIDTIATRIAHIRTWTFIANRVDWLRDPLYWQELTRNVEDKLSDALHEGLQKRFVDKRTSTLMKRLREKDDLYAEIDDQGRLLVEDHFVGTISGFQFTPAEASAGLDSRAARTAVNQVLSKELMMRAKDLMASEVADFSFNGQGEIFWNNVAVAQLKKGDHILKPHLTVLADEQLEGPSRDEVDAKLTAIVTDLLAERLPSLMQLNGADELSGLAKGVAFQLIEGLGVLQREPIADDIRQLDQEARGRLRKYGVRFGAFHIFMPYLLKPAASELLRLLWALHHDALDQVANWDLPKAGLTSADMDPRVDRSYYRVAGFHGCGKRVVRVDMLERLADLIRPLVMWREGGENASDRSRKLQDKKAAHEAIAIKVPEQDEPVDAADAQCSLKAQTDKEHPDAHKAASETEPTVDVAPAGATGDGGFVIIPEMMSIMGCSADELAVVLKSLGYRATPLSPPQKGQEGSTEPLATEVAPVASSDPDKPPLTDGEEAPVFVWRPRKKTGGKRAGSNGQKRQGKNAGKKGRGRSYKQTAKHKNRAVKGRATQQPKPLDPDSPFAKLANLKEQMDGQAKE